jgi:UrcA family protein
MNRFMPIIAISTLAIIHQAAHANPPTEGLPAVTVRFADLDLNHTPGAIALYQRIKYAAEQACSSFRGRDIKTHELLGRCVENSVAASIAKIDRPVVTQYYQSLSDSRNSLTRVAKN